MRSAKLLGLCGQRFNSSVHFPWKALTQSKGTSRSNYKMLIPIKAMKCLMIPFRYKEGRAHSFMLFVVSDTDGPSCIQRVPNAGKIFWTTTKLRFNAHYMWRCVRFIPYNHVYLGNRKEPCRYYTLIFNYYTSTYSCCNSSHCILEHKHTCNCWYHLYMFRHLDTDWENTHRCLSTNVGKK